MALLVVFALTVIQSTHYLTKRTVSETAKWSIIEFILYGLYPISHAHQSKMGIYSLSLMDIYSLSLNCLIYKTYIKHKQDVDQTQEGSHPRPFRWRKNKYNQPLCRLGFCIWKHATHVGLPLPRKKTSAKKWRADHPLNLGYSWTGEIQVNSKNLL